MDRTAVDSIREKLNIVEVIREYVPSLKKAGRSYKACCPFHKEKTPSFHVDEDKQLFYCFGCQTGGDIFAFVMKIENISFAEAGEKLAEKAGVEWRSQAPLGPAESERAEIRRAIDFAVRYYQTALKSARYAEPARTYLEGRHLSPEMTEKFRLGYAHTENDSFIKAARVEGFTDGVLFKAGLLGRGDGGRVWDYFRGRVLFPIQNHRGDTVAFGGRVLDDREPKYLNSPETPVFSKGQVLFGLSQAAQATRKAGRLIVCEGYMDVIACHQAGVENSAAPLGTAFGADHARLIKRYCQQVVLLFDPDPAGVRAALRAAPILISGGLQVKVASLGGGLDPDEFLQERGREAFDAVIAGAKDIIEFHADVVLAALQHPVSSHDKARAADELLPTALVQPNPIVRADWIKMIADRLAISEAVLRQRAASPAIAAAAGSAREEEQELPERPDEGLPPPERELLRMVVRTPAFATVCGKLLEGVPLSPKVAALLTAMNKVCEGGCPDSEVIKFLCAEKPEHEGLVQMLAVEPEPASRLSGATDEEPQNDIARAARAEDELADRMRAFEELCRRIRRTGLEHRQAELRASLADLGRKGQDTRDIQTQLQKIAATLKGSGKL